MADDSFLKQCGGFNPAPDFLIQKYGFEAAHVWGAIWRYCQMNEQDRPRSHEAMAKRAGMSRRTFIDYLNLLIKDGYIEDLDPGVRNRPHLYDTKKGEELIKAGMQFSHTESAIQEDRCAELAQDNDVGMRKLHTGYAVSTQPGMQNLHLIDSKKIQPKDTTKELAPKKIASPEQNKLFLILAGLCRIELKVATDKQIGQLDQAAKALVKTVKDSDQFKEKFGIYWLTVDWRGKQDQPPTPAQIREVYGDYCHWLEHGQQNGATNGNQRTYKTRQDGHAIKPREMDGATIRDVESEIAELERKLQIRGNFAGATS